MLEQDLLIKANNNDLDAMLEVADAYYHAINVPQDDTQMYIWYSKIVEIFPTCALALNRLGNCYNYGWGIDENPSLAVSLYKKASELGDSEAHYNLGCAYRYGKGIAQDYELAIHHFLIAIESNNSNAMVDLGDMYNEGLGTEQDYSTALKYYRLAADAKNASGLLSLGIAYLDGNGVEKNEILANNYFSKSAELGNVLAQYVLALNYFDGTGVDKDLSMAIYWLNKSAEKNYCKSILTLAECYYKGHGVEKNEKKANELFEKAYKLNAEEALEMQYNLYMQDQKILEACAWAKKYIQELTLPDQNKIYYQFLYAIFMGAYTKMRVAGVDDAISEFLSFNTLLDKYIQYINPISPQTESLFGNWKYWIAVCAYKSDSEKYNLFSKKCFEEAYNYGKYTSCWYLYVVWYSTSEREKITSKFYHNMALSVNEETAKDDLDIIYLCLAEMNLQGLGTAQNLTAAYTFATRSFEMGFEEAGEMLSHFSKDFFGNIKYID